MNSLEQSLQKLNENLSNDFDKTKMVYEEANNNHCSDHTKRQLLNKGRKKRESPFVFVTLSFISARRMVTASEISNEGTETWFIVLLRCRFVQSEDSNSDARETSGQRRSTSLDRR